MRTEEEIKARIKELEEMRFGSPPINVMMLNQEIALLEWVLEQR